MEAMAYLGRFQRPVSEAGFAYLFAETWLKGIMIMIIVMIIIIIIIMY